VVPQLAKRSKYSEEERLFDEERNRALAAYRHKKSLEADLPALSDEELQAPEVDEVTDEEALEERIEKILNEVYTEYNARLYMRHTSQRRFFADNREMARKVALEELMAERMRKARQLVRRQRLSC